MLWCEPLNHEIKSEIICKLRRKNVKISACNGCDGPEERSAQQDNAVGDDFKPAPAKEIEEKNSAGVSWGFYVDKRFDPFTNDKNGRLALESYNAILISLNWGFAHKKIDDTIGLFKTIRMKALKSFAGQYGQTGLNHLAKILSYQYGHWVSGGIKSSFLVVEKIMSHLSESEARHSCRLERYTASLRSWQSKNPPTKTSERRGRRKRFPEIESCMVHADRKVLSSGLCGSCYQKALKMYLVEFITAPISPVIVEILTAKSRYCSKGKAKCVNHPFTVVYKGVHCAHCWFKIKRSLEEEDTLRGSI